MAPVSVWPTNQTLVVSLSCDGLKYAFPRANGISILVP